MKAADEFQLHPAIELPDGRTVRNAAQAIALLREHEMRPGVDDRDEVLHALERAQTDAERASAVDRFRGWVETWGTTLPVTTKPSSTRGPA